MVFPCSRAAGEQVHHQAPCGGSSAPVGSSASRMGGRWPWRAQWPRAASARRKAGWAHGPRGRPFPPYPAARRRAVCAHAAHAVVHHGQRHVLQRAGAGHQVERLEYKSDLPAADAGELLVAQCAYVHAVQHIGAFRGAVQRADDVHQRGFARTGRAHDGHKFAFAHRQVNAVQHLPVPRPCDGDA